MGQAGRTTGPLLITSAAGRGEAEGVRSHVGGRTVSTVKSEIAESEVGPRPPDGGLVQTLRELGALSERLEMSHRQE